MTLLPQWIRRQSRFAGVYAINAGVSLHYFLVIYINSSFISRFVPEAWVSWVYLIASIGSVALFLALPHLLALLGNYLGTLTTFALEAVALAVMSTAPPLPVLLPAFMLHVALLPVLYLHLDVFLEHYVRDERTTGGVRGVFMTVLNVAQVSAPLLVAWLAGGAEFWRVYLLAAAALLVATGIVAARLRAFRDPGYLAEPPLGALAKLWRHRPFRDAFATHFMLRFFYAWMTVYAPLYLFRHIGFTWDAIGVMFAIILVPFLLLELPLGRLMDTRLSERSIMIAGFAILVISTASLSFITTADFLIWTLALVATRVGAACVEIATESYFFKHVDGRNADSISFYRLTRPLSYVAAMGLSGLALLILPLALNFLVLGCLLLIGLAWAWHLRSTRPGVAVTGH